MADRHNPAPLKRVAGVILHRDGCVLLQHRDDNPAIRWPGAWAIFGGGVEEGETPEAAARREIEEELGLVIQEPLTLVVQQRYPDRERFIFAAALAVLPEALTLHEGQGMALASRVELDRYPIIPIHREILDQFFEDR